LLRQPVVAREIIPKRLSNLPKSRRFHKSRNKGRPKLKRPLLSKIADRLRKIPGSTIVRLYIPITLENGSEIYIDLDTNTEYDIVSKEFAYKVKLLAIPFLSLSIKGVALDRLRTYRIVKRAYIGIDRDLRLEGSPILLSRTFINKFDVILYPSVNK
ncbi:hypothetical protein N7519_005109, partial [Penicillium mononematosum]|uniref:uncharacterized protein n=1 Tax=Penicillium mononematosum TaxID=268346 RepID=UPI0025470FE0